MRLHRFMANDSAMGQKDAFASISLPAPHGHYIIDAIASIIVAAMNTRITSPQQLGLLIRATRKSQNVRLDDLAGSAGVGHVFAREVERGKSTVQLGRVMRLLAELGIDLKADVSPDAMKEFARLEATGVKPLRPRRDAKRQPDTTRE